MTATDAFATTLKYAHTFQMTDPETGANILYQLPAGRTVIARPETTDTFSRPTIAGGGYLAEVTDPETGARSRREAIITTNPHTVPAN